MLAGQHRWPIVGGSIRFAGIRLKTSPLDAPYSYDIAGLHPPETWCTKVSGVQDPPEGPLEGGVF